MSVFLLSLTLCLGTSRAFGDVTAGNPQLVLVEKVFESQFLNTAGSESPLDITVYLRSSVPLIAAPLQINPMDTSFPDSGPLPINCFGNGIATLAEPASVLALGGNEYQLKCSLKIDSDAPRGIQNVELDGLNWFSPAVRYLPANAVDTFTISQKNSFGMNESVIKILADQSLYFGSGQRNWAIPVAINAPSNYSAPMFARSSEGYEIFNAFNAAATPTKVTFNIKKTSMKVICPMTNGQILGDNTYSVIRVGGLTFRHQEEISYANFRNQKVSVNCAIASSLQNRGFLSYLENKPLEVRIPKK